MYENNIVLLHPEFNYKKGYEKVSIIFGDAADAGVRTDIGGMSAGSREQLSADQAVRTHREDHSVDGVQYPEGMAAASVGISTSHVSE